MPERPECQTVGPSPSPNKASEDLQLLSCSDLGLLQGIRPLRLEHCSREPVRRVLGTVDAIQERGLSDGCSSQCLHSRRRLERRYTLPIRRRVCLACVRKLPSVTMD